MNVVCCTDNNFVMPCGVMLTSLCVNNPLDELNVYLIIDNSVTDENKKKLKSIFDIKKRHRLEFCLINGDFLSDYPKLGVVSPHVSKATYYRFFLPDLLPKEIDKVLYLDCDLVVRKNLNELWNVDVSSVAVACVMDHCDSAISLYNVLRYPSELGYFNAGVQLINLDYWRKHFLKDQFVQFVLDYPDRIKFHDQDVMNYVLKDSKLKLSLKYNVQTNFYYKLNYMTFDYWKNEEELENAIKDPFILHFSSGVKPWYDNCCHPMKNEFIRYKLLSPWKKTSVIKQPKTFKCKLKEFLIRIGFLNKEPVPFKDISISN